MKINFHIKKSICVMGLAFIFAGCGGGSATTSTDADLSTNSVKPESSPLNDTSMSSTSVSIPIEQDTENTLETIAGTQPTTVTVQTSTTESAPIEVQTIEPTSVPTQDTDEVQGEEQAIETAIISASTESQTVEPTSVSPQETVTPGVEEITEETLSEAVTELDISAKAVQSGQVKDSAGNGLANVIVSIGESMTVTDENGFYTLTDLSASEEESVTFTKKGYLPSSTKITLKEASDDSATAPNYLEMSLYTYASWNPWSFDSQIGATGGAVEAPASIYVDAEGNSYEGIIYSNWSFKDTMQAEGRDAFPGAFEGMNSDGVLVPFVAYGLMSLELKDGIGNALDITGKITLVLNGVTGTTENTVPLWYYDYDQGLWIEEGYAERQSDGVYRADITHPGTWSLAQPVEEEVGIYRGQIVDADGGAISDVRLYAVGDNWISSDLSTDENGAFEIKVIPGKSFQLKAYNYKDKYGANYNGVISAIASGEVVED